jgi:hypothetical protein
MGAIASAIGILEAIAIGGVLSLASGLAAFAWYRRIRAREAADATSAVVEAALVNDARAAAVLQSIAPNTSAALSPPKPNEVLNTRR